MKNLEYTFRMDFHWEYMLNLYDAGIITVSSVIVRTQSVSAQQWAYSLHLVKC